MVKSEMLKRSTAYDFILVAFTNQTCRSKNKRDRGTIKYDYHHLTWKKGLNFNCNSIDRCAANDFL